MDLDGRIGFSKFPKLRTSKSLHQGEIGEEMSDLGVVGLQDAPPRWPASLERNGETCSLQFSPKQTLNEFWL